MQADPHRSRKAHGAALGLVIVLCVAPLAAACPMCKDGVATSPLPTTAPAEAAALDFNTSIYVMLGVVAAVGATVGRAMVKAVRG